MSKKNEVVEQKTNLPANVPEGSWGDEGLDSKDILLSKILLMQGQSDVVQSGDAVPGQLVDSVSTDVIGGVHKVGKATEIKTIPLIAFSSFKTWITSEWVPSGKGSEGKFEFRKQEPLTPENENWPQEEVINGVQMRRDRCLNFYVLRPSDIESGVAFPMLVSFRRTSYKAGRKLSTMAAKLKQFKQPMAAQVFELGVEQLEKDGNSFWAFDVVTTRRSTPVELAQAYKWYETFKTAVVKVDDSDLKEPMAAAPVASGAAVADDDVEF